MALHHHDALRKLARICVLSSIALGGHLELVSPVKAIAVLHVVQVDGRRHNIRRRGEFLVKDILEGQTARGIVMFDVLKTGFWGKTLILEEINRLFNSLIELLEGHRVIGELGRQCWRAVLPVNHVDRVPVFPDDTKADWDHPLLIVEKVFVRQH